MRRKEEHSHQQQLTAARKSYNVAAAEGNREEEARWANVIGNILKHRGEYVEALTWLRKDYDVSIRYLPEKQLLATCQSLGEIYLRLHQHREALVYQKKHLEMADDANDLVEQQRAATQLGRTYHELFMNSDDDHSAIRNAKKYFRSSMELARAIKRCSFSTKGSFNKEYIDAHNNLGMLEIDLHNYEEAEKFLMKGLEICDAEEVPDDDDARSRLHHNLGNVYMELRKWKDAREHIAKDISICNKIGHLQGEAKGYINLGESLNRLQQYKEAILCYQKALDLAKSLEDEKELAKQISQNIETVREAMKVMDEVKKEEQNLKKMERNTQSARGKETERKCLLENFASLGSLIDKSRLISAWLKVLEFAKRKKRVASELYDSEKLGDSYMDIGEANQNLRHFSKALKWYKKALDIFESIGSLEGQAMAKINIGANLDSCGNWVGALSAFKEANRIADLANMSHLQLSSLENIHYSYMIRFDDAEEARKTKLLIDQLKESNRELDSNMDKLKDFCSETDTELDDRSSDDMSAGCFSPKSNELNSSRSKAMDTFDDSDGDIPLRSLLRPSEKIAKKRAATAAAPNASSILCSSSKQTSSRSTGNLSAANRKRPRIILTDDEGEDEEVYCSEWMVHNSPSKGVSTHVEETRNCANNHVHEVQDASPVASRCSLDALTPANLVKSTCSAVDVSDSHGNVNDTHIGSWSSFHNETSTANVHASSDHRRHAIFKVDEDLVHIDVDLCRKLTMEQMKVELACLYYLRLSKQNRSTGLVPVIEDMKYNGQILESMDTLCDLNVSTRDGCIEVSINKIVPRHLMKLYVDCCDKQSMPPSLTVVKHLYNSELPDDEIIVSDCKLQDVSVAPLLNALQLHKTLAVLDLSHNLLGNETVEKLKQVFISSGQSKGSLILNLHNNRLGPASLYHIRECPVVYDRLEVLNISGNRLTDACASYLSTILQTCKALYSLDIENCSITSRTIQKVADSLSSESALTHLYLGYNQPVAGSAIIGLLRKLGKLNRFQELNLNGINLTRPVVDSLCQLATDCCLSGLMLGSTNIGSEAAMQLLKPLSKETQELSRLDLSSCGLKCDYIFSLRNEVALVGGILELNLGGNHIREEGGNALSSLLSNAHCRLRVLIVNKCELGLNGVLQVVQALQTNVSLQELNLAENVNASEIQALSDIIRIDRNLSSLLKVPEPDVADALVSDINARETFYNHLEVADSEDDNQEVDAALSGLEEGNACSSETRTRLSGNWLMQQLSSSIKTADKLQLLDLSNNTFPLEIAEMLFSAWSSGVRTGSAQKHIAENILHFSVLGMKCCGIKPCCRRT